MDEGSDCGVAGGLAGIAGGLAAVAGGLVGVAGGLAGVAGGLAEVAGSGGMICLASTEAAASAVSDLMPSDSTAASVVGSFSTGVDSTSVNGTEADSVGVASTEDGGVGGNLSTIRRGCDCFLFSRFSLLEDVVESCESSLSDLDDSSPLVGTL